MKQAVCFFHETDHGRILAVSRRGRPTEFGLPGGKVDAGETREHACLRELFEETGLTPIGPIVKIYSSVCLGDVDYHTTVFRSTGVTGVVNSEEGCVVQWVEPQVLLDGPFGTFNRKLFAALHV